MEKRVKEQDREEHIVMEVIVDTYGSEEQAIGWYYYLEGKITFPFKARCVRERLISPLRASEEITVERMAPEDDCMSEVFIMAQWKGRLLGVPLP